MARRNQHLVWPLTIVAGAVCAVLALTGCRRDVGTLDEEDRNEPLVRQAIQREQQGRIDDAIALYQEALARTPTLARAHFDLAQLLHDHGKDYVEAIHHYRRYLALRPNTEKKAMIEGRIRQAGQLYAATFFRTETHAAEKVAALERENLELKEHLQRLEEELRQARQPRTDRKRKNGESGTGAARTYQVARGDTLMSIAEDIYRDPNRWQAIYEANRDQMEDTTDLREGQILKIP